MIASLLTLNREDCKALKITDPYSVHRVVYSLFPKKNGQDRAFLYADKGGSFSERFVLLLSQDEPIQPEFGRISSKKIDNRFLEHDIYAFEVIINPVKRENNSSRILPIRGKEELTQWFIKKSQSFGFSVQSQSLMVSDTDIVRFKKNGHTVTLGKAKFTGKLEVMDRNLFIQSFQNGIGKAKGFGFGLLQLVPLIKASVDA